MERLFTWEELAHLWFVGDDYGGVTVYCRSCQGRAPTSRKELGYASDGDPLELLRPAIEHVATVHGGGREQ